MPIRTDPEEVMRSIGSVIEWDFGPQWKRDPPIMGAVPRNDQIKERYFEVDDELIRVTVTVARKPPHVLEEEGRV